MPGAQVIVDQLKAGAAVIIISIDDSERRINRIGSRQNGMGGAPRLDAALRHGKTFRQNIQLLIRIAHI